MEEQVIEPRVRVNGLGLVHHNGKAVSIMGTVLNVSFHMLIDVFFRRPYIPANNLGLLL
jgi:hypothetical protein